MPKRKTAKELLQERKVARVQKKKELGTEYDKRKKGAEELGTGWLKLFGRNERNKKTFVELGLKEWDARQPLIISGKYLDEKKTRSIFQQKFISYVRDTFPEVIEELRNFVADFDAVFAADRDLYHAVFNWFRIDLWDVDQSLDQFLSREIDKLFQKSELPSLVALRTEKYDAFNGDFKWGQFKFLFEFLNLLFVGHTEEARESACELLRQNLAFSSDLRLSKETCDDLLENVSIITVLRFIQDAERSYLSTTAEYCFSNSFKEIFGDSEVGLKDLIKLHHELLKWCEKHNLEKDWLLQYAYFFLSEFSKCGK